LASGLAKQYDNFHDALQEVVDNGISATVPNEAYFQNPTAYDPVELYVALIRDGDTVWFIVADNGDGIAPDTLAETVFEVSNTSASTGILNNVGWGAKQSFAWFESKVVEDDVRTETGDHPPFCIVTRPQEGDQAYKVEGPITEDKYVEPATEDDWTFGIKDEVTNLNSVNHGTRVHLPCSWEQVNKDLWGGEGTTLTKRVQALRTELGVKFRRILNAREENRIVLTVVDRDDPDMASMEVHPIDLQFEEYAGEERPVTFDITVDGATYNIEYERGRLDFDAMFDNARERDDRLLTGSGNLRVGYRPSKKYQGIDIYANGRVMMTSVFGELYRKQNKPDEYLSKDDVYNHFGGEVRIIPENPAESVPTDNKKTAVDTSHQLWEKLEEELHERGGPVNTWKAGRSNDDDDSEGADQPNNDSSAEEDTVSRKQSDTETDTEEKAQSNTEQGESDDEPSPGDEDSSSSRTDGGRSKSTTADQGLGCGPNTVDDGDDGTDEVGVAAIDDSEFRSRWQNSEFDHNDLVERLKAKLEAESLTQRVDTEKHYKGTRVDVDQVLDDGSHILWEVRTSQQNRRAVYDISMYQDVFKEVADPDLFRRSVLLSDGLSTDAEDALRGDEHRRDVCGDPYVLDQQDIIDKLG
jgi:hypothetical protein